MANAASGSIDLNADPNACAAWIARFLQARGVDRVVTVLLAAEVAAHLGLAALGDQALDLLAAQPAQHAGHAVARAGAGKARALRLEHGVRQTAAGNPVLLPRLWNSAHPACVMDSYPQDSVCSLSGMTAEGRFICTAPRPAFYLEHALCGASEQLAAQPDLLCLLPDQQRLFTLTRWLVPIDMTDREVSRQVRICRT